MNSYGDRAKGHGTYGLVTRSAMSGLRGVTGVTSRRGGRDRHHHASRGAAVRSSRSLTHVTYVCLFTDMFTSFSKTTSSPCHQSFPPSSFKDLDEAL